MATEAPISTTIPRAEVALGAAPFALGGLAILTQGLRSGLQPRHFIFLATTGLLAVTVGISAQVQGHEGRRLFLRDTLLLASFTALSAVFLNSLPGWACVAMALHLGVSLARLLEDVVRLSPRTHRVALILGGVLPIVGFVIGSCFVFSRGPIELAADSGSYVKAAREPLASPELWGGARAPLFPLAIKLFASPPDFAPLVRFQLLLGLLAWVVLAGVVARNVRRPWLGALATLVILRIGAGCDLLFWHRLVLSESLSLSLQTLVVAALCHAVTQGLDPAPSRKRQAALASLVLLPAAPWTLVRDSNAYLLLAGTGLIGLRLVTRRVSREREAVFWGVLATGFVTLFLVANVSSNQGRRWQFPLVNVLGQRILTDPRRTAEFAARGFPTGEASLRFRGKWASDYDWSGLQPWLDERAKNDYARWLLGRPVKSFLEPLQDWQAVSASTTFYDHGQAAPAWQAMGQPVFELPASELVAALATALSLMVLATYRRGLGWKVVFPASLLAVVYPGVFTAWHGDAMEIARHALGVMVLARVAIWIGILFAIDVLLEPRGGDPDSARPGA